MPIQYPGDLREYLPVDLGMVAVNLNTTGNVDAPSRIPLIGYRNHAISLVVTAAGAAAATGTLNIQAAGFIGSTQVTDFITLAALAHRQAAGTHRGIVMWGDDFAQKVDHTTPAELTIGTRVDVFRCMPHSIQLRLDRAVAHNQGTSLVLDVYFRSTAR